MRWLLPLTLAILVGCEDKPDDSAEPDGDGDGFPVSEDCDDTDPDVNPGASERCNGIDDDCDDEIDEEGAAGSDTFYADADGDGYGSETDTIEICDLPSGYVDTATDCDDTRDDVYPAAAELCDEVDNDCDEEVDEDASDASTWYTDNDGDGYGDEDDSITSCDEQDGYVDNTDDCDDTTADRSPDVDEICDEIDNNCDGHIDEDGAADAATWYGDGDGDGFGSDTATTQACEQPDDHVENAGDCDDADATVNPDADELCDDVDNDCDEDVDEDATDAPIWYADNDEDNFGDPDSSMAACDQPSGYVTDTTDCDDGDSDINPLATEICDGIDNDCDGTADDDNLVTLDDTTNYTSLVQAVRNASSGSTVVACDGTYVENVEVTVDLTLESMNGSGSTTIDGDGSGPCIDIESGSAEITGFTLTDGSGDLHPEVPSVYVGGGLFVLSEDTVTLTDLDIIDNEADFGAGLFANEGSVLVVSDTTFQLNDAEESGGAMYLYEAIVSLSGVTIEDNYASAAAGAFVDGATLDLDLCTFEDNYAADYGGGLYAYASAVTASDDTFITGNTAGDWGGGIYLYDGSTWSGGEVSDNEADFGGGFYADSDTGGTNEIEDLYCAENWADTSGGCGYAANDLNLTSVDLFDNGALWGAGMMVDDATVYLMSSTVEENVADYNGGGVYVINDAVLMSVNSDWGTSTTDNDPDDIYIDSSSTAYTSYATGETFTCSDVVGSCY